jgi:Ca2+/Na+ antiporter
VTFYIRKALANGRIRFGVSPRSLRDEIDAAPDLSTGGRGEFLRKRMTGFYFADNRASVNAPVLPEKTGISGTPFLKSVVDGTRRGWAFLGMIIAGALLLLLGFAVLAQGRPQGWVEIILGIILIVVPIVLTAQARRKIREQEERERVAREEEEKRHRALLASYTTALERLRQNPGRNTLEAATREHENLTLSYDVWCKYARRTALDIAFEALGKLGTAKAGELGELVTRVSRAVGLAPADELGVKLDIYRTTVWHLLADDRLGNTQAAELRRLREGLDIKDEDIPLEARIVEEFDRLRGITKANLPKDTGADLALGFHEYCLHASRGSLLRKVWQRENGKPVAKLVPAESCVVYVTNRRVVISAKKKQEIPLVKIDDVEVDADPNTLTIRTAKSLKDVELQVEDPIYTAALLDIATTLDERPRGFA